MAESKKHKAKRYCSGDISETYHPVNFRYNNFLLYAFSFLLYLKNF